MFSTFLELFRDEVNREECRVQGLMALGVIGLVLMVFFLRLIFG